MFITKKKIQKKYIEDEFGTTDSFTGSGTGTGSRIGNSTKSGSLGERISSASMENMIKINANIVPKEKNRESWVISTPTREDLKILEDPIHSMKNSIQVQELDELK